MPQARNLEAVRGGAATTGHPPAAQGELLVDSRHLTVDLQMPSGARQWEPFVHRHTWFPVGEATGWQDIYTTWFGRGDRPLANYRFWFGAPPQVDARIRRAYEPLWREATAGRLTDWEEDPRACLAQLILVDQFSRNMFRGTPDAFRHDALAVHLANRCLEHLSRGADYHLEEVLIMAWPWLHSESLELVLRAQRWVYGLGELVRGTPYHFRLVMHQFGFDRHVRCLQRFGRYPHRNALLGRLSTPGELAYLAQEAEMWERDQATRERGGTLGYRLGELRFLGRMMLYFIATRNEHLQVGLLRDTLRSLLRGG
jgi:uncharacterized protein (DUF924 family)